MFDGKSVMITGATGSFGKKIVSTLYNKYNPKRIIVYSRDELKQFEMQQTFIDSDPMRYFIGDIRDYRRLKMAMENVDIVVHAAAMKHVYASEYNPFEAVKTNIIGSQNLIEASIEKGVKKVIALSTDKATAPTNLYGATKLTSDKLFIAANNYSGKNDIIFSIVRYGNVMGSRGSVIPLFLKQKSDGQVTITDEKMTRFNITIQEGVNFVIKSLELMIGGEVFVPKMPSYRILDLVKAVAPNANKKIIGIRPGEKLHEELITKNDAQNTLEFKKYFIIFQSENDKIYNDVFLKNKNECNSCDDNFSYNSYDNSHFLTSSQLEDLIKMELTD